MKRCAKRLWLVLWLAAAMFPALCAERALAAPREIETQRSSLTIRVYKTGLLSAFGHEHEVRARIQKGTFDDESGAVDLVVDAHDLRVLDRDVSENDRAQIQATMLGPKVLDSEKFAEIKFNAVKAERAGDHKWTVRGDLMLHGQVRPVKVDVTGDSGHYRGSARLRQTDFGMTPVTVAGGSIKVKDEVRVEFEIVAKSGR